MRINLFGTFNTSPTRRSQAHVALDMIHEGADTSIFNMFGYADGSAVELTPHGWAVTECVPECRCIVGVSSAIRAASKLAFRGRSGIVPCR